jgi:hypothetical protein
MQHDLDTPAEFDDTVQRAHRDMRFDPPIFLRGLIAADAASAEVIHAQGG